MELLEESWGKRNWKRRQLENQPEYVGEFWSDLDELHDFDEYVLNHWNHTAQPSMSDY